MPRSHKPRFNTGAKSKRTAAKLRNGEAVIEGNRVDTCSSGKRAWTDRKAAKEFVRKFNLRVRVEGIEHGLDLYRCPECGLLHTTKVHTPEELRERWLERRRKDG